MNPMNRTDDLTRCDPVWRAAEPCVPSDIRYRRNAEGLRRATDLLQGAAEC
jgi:hypothetical protein